jgi:hypothetical protein
MGLSLVCYALIIIFSYLFVSSLVPRWEDERVQCQYCRRMFICTCRPRGGNQYVNLEDIIDHKFDENIEPTPNSTKDWKLCNLWKDGATSWGHLRDMKHGLPIQTAEYVISRGIHDLLVFKC